MKSRISAFICSCILLCSCSFSSQKENTNNISETDNPNELYLLVGSYSTPEEEGIKLYKFDEATGDSKYISGLKGISNPSFLTIASNGKNIYAVGEDEGLTSTANAILLENEKMTLLNSQLTNGGAPCHINFDPKEEFVITANYMGGSITVFPIEKDGKLGEKSNLIQFEGKSIDKERQEQPHLHCIKITPDGKYLLANDLGTDKIHMFPFADNNTDKSSATLLDQANMKDIKIKDGSGPRHICFHPNKKNAYLINELSGEVVVFNYDNGEMDAIQYIKADSVGAKGSADIHVSPDGKFVYSSNRLKEDGIAVFAVDGTNGKLNKIDYTLTGKHPRNFMITPNGKYLLVACRDDNRIEIYSRNTENGRLENTGKYIESGKPVCLKVIRQDQY